MSMAPVTAEQPKPTSTVDVEVKIVEGRDLVHSHHFSTPSFFVEMELDEAKERTTVGRKGDKAPKWDKNFVFATNLSSCLLIRVYCHRGRRADHVIGEATLDLFKADRNKDIDVKVYNPAKNPPERGQLILHLKVSIPVIVSSGGMSTLDRQTMRRLAIILRPLSSEQLQALSPVWKHFLSSFSSVFSHLRNIADLDPPAQIVVGAVSFAVKTVIDQIDRDEKVERLVKIMADLYTYFLDADPVERILTFQKTLERLLSQTSECAYFIGDYRKIKSFVKRDGVNMVSDADTMIAQFERAFGDLRLELILGSSLQTTVVSFRILEMVESIESGSLLSIDNLSNLKRATWDSSRACLPGTYEDNITDVVRWARHTGETQQSRIYMLLGPQGCGNSPIAHTIARIFDEQKRLGAGVLPHDQDVDSHALCSTIAYQLAGYDATIRQRMAQIIKANPLLASAKIEQQFPDLIVAAVKDLTIVGPVIIVVDGLTDSAEDQRFLKVIMEYSPLLPLNFRIVLAARYGKMVTDMIRSSEQEVTYAFLYGDSS